MALKLLLADGPRWLGCSKVKPTGAAAADGWARGGDQLQASCTGRRLLCQEERPWCRGTTRATCAHMHVGVHLCVHAHVPVRVFLSRDGAAFLDWTGDAWQGT